MAEWIDVLFGVETPGTQETLYYMKVSIPTVRPNYSDAELSA